VQLDLLDARIARSGLGGLLCGNFLCTVTQTHVRGVDVVEEDAARAVIRRIDALEEEGDAVAAERAAVLQQQRLMHGAACGIVAAGGFIVKGLDEQTVRLSRGEHGRVLADEGKARTMVGRGQGAKCDP